MKTVITLLVLALTTTPAWADNGILYGLRHASGVVPVAEEMEEQAHWFEDGTSCFVPSPARASRWAPQRAYLTHGREIPRSE